MPLYRVTRQTILLEVWQEWADHPSAAQKEAVLRSPDEERVIGGLSMEASPEVMKEGPGTYRVEVWAGMMFRTEVPIDAAGPKEAEQAALTLVGDLDFNDDPAPLTYAVTIDKI